VCLDARQHVAEVSERVDVPRLARRDERVEPGDVGARGGVTDEEEVLPAEGNTAKRALRGVVVDGDAGVVEEATEVVPA
jgi:hypothetical protein